MDLPPPGVARSSLATLRKKKRGNSLQFCAALQELHSAQLKFGSITKAARAGRSSLFLSGPEICTCLRLDLASEAEMLISSSLQALSPV